MALRMRMRLWSRVQPKAVLRAVITSSGEVACSEGMSTALADHWREVFDIKTADEQAMRQGITFELSGELSDTFTNLDVWAKEYIEKERGDRWSDSNEG